MQMIPKVILCLALLLTLLIAPVQANDTVTLITNNKFSSTKTFKFLPVDRKDLQLQLSNCPDIFSPVTRNIGRQAMENVLICHALRASGKYKKIQYVLSGNTDRQKLDLMNGKADILGQTTFKNSLERSKYFSADNFIVSQAVIKKEQLSWHAYTTKNQMAFVTEAIASNKFSDLIGVGMLSWHSSVKTLDSLGLKSVKKITDPDNLYTILQRKRAHITLSSNSKGTISRGGPLYRVPGFSIDPPYGRHFVFHKDKSDLAIAVDNYLTDMRNNNDQITQAFRHADALN